MKLKKFCLLILILIVAPSNILLSETPYYIDYKFVLNQSLAGKKAQDDLKKKLNKGIESLQKQEKSLQASEKKIIEQKKIISADEYKKKITELRKKVSTLQKQRNQLMDTVAKQRAKAKNVLLKNLNPIIKEYMKNNNIKMIIDKKFLVMADESLNITKPIVELLNKKLKSIDLN
tara:strand:+ start:895 stop:1419 length:525 start_codon:yes stop_codon:yes gene_type:complete